jgi:uncharacterized membrane protein
MRLQKPMLAEMPWLAAKQKNDGAVKPGPNPIVVGNAPRILR